MPAIAEPIKSVPESPGNAFTGYLLNTNNPRIIPARERNKNEACELNCIATIDAKIQIIKLVPIVQPFSPSKVLLKLATPAKNNANRIIHNAPIILCGKKKMIATIKEINAIGVARIFQPTALPKNLFLLSSKKPIKPKTLIAIPTNNNSNPKLRNKIQ